VLAHPWVGGTIGIILLLLVWAAFATILPSHSIVPTPWATTESVVNDATSYFLPNLGSTLERAGLGYVYGNLAGLIVAGIVLLLPRLEEVATQLGVISQCLPITAVGPIIILIFGGRTAAIFLAALLCFFTTMVGSILGLRSASAVSLDVVTAAGGGSFMRIRKVRAIAALPAVFTALKIAVPGAILGAVVGEYLGGIDSGVGVALNAAQRNQMPDRVWALSILIGLIALLGYGLVGLIGRLVTPWANSRGSA
jgi:ABC-type nitrate/sulfonate/bicarbonate transport system permease component